MNILACDLGGTKVLLGIYSENSKTKAPNLILKKKYSSSEWDSFYSILDDFILTECKNKIPSTACLAIAGAIKNNSAKITNLNWEISHKYLKRKYNFQNLELINDFSVLIYGITALFFFKQFISLFNNLIEKFGRAASCIKTFLKFLFLI